MILKEINRSTLLLGFVGATVEFYLCTFGHFEHKVTKSRYDVYVISGRKA